MVGTADIMWHNHIHDEEDGRLHLDDGLDQSNNAAPLEDTRMPWKLSMVGWPEKCRLKLNGLRPRRRRWNC